MTQPTVGSSERPLRVAVVGAGPSGFYVIQSLLKADDVAVAVDLFDRLPAPYGLVRYGVAPDHQKIKNVTKVYDRLAADERVRFFGGIEIGKDLTVDELRSHYDALVLCTGAQTDRQLGIPGEDLAGSHAATEFVAWYNGHPDYEHCTFDLDCERAVVVGIGNVALDVARILLRTPAELMETDIAGYAFEALKKSRIREVVVLGRRGPAQAAFSPREIKELGEMEAADARTVAEEVALDPLSQEDMEASTDRSVVKNCEVVATYAAAPAEPKPKTMWIRFCVSPTALIGDHAGRVQSVEIVHNVLERRPNGSLGAVAGDVTETIEAGLVFRSVGYRGVPVPGVPFREDWGTIPHEEGRVEPGLYASGWIKRGPSGVIGTNRPDAQESVRALLADHAAGKLTAATEPLEGIERILRERGARWIDFPTWQKLDEIELARGEAVGRPRDKLISREEMFDAAEQAESKS
ncbi:MAG: FAD-dependent oxidoreductase [Planctomycetota bacterium]|nr:FAD-dependent oxidoreductase [Planctomycetota bacterium]